jgi:hypothetical protein
VEPVITSIEQRLTWGPSIGKPLTERVSRIANALMTLKEIEHFGRGQEGSVAERQKRLIDHLLAPLEVEWCGAVQKGSLIPRIKQLRSKMVPNLTAGEISTTDRDRIWRNLASIYLAQQVASYPNEYFMRPTTVTRVLETVERLEEDLTDRVRVHRPLHAIIQIDEAITIGTDKAPKDAEDPIMIQLRCRLQSMLDVLAAEADVFDQ